MSAYTLSASVHASIVEARMLREFHDGHKGLTGCWQGVNQPGFECCDLIRAIAWADVVRLVVSNGNDAGEYALEAAHYAHLAVPGLADLPVLDELEAEAGK